MTPWLIGAAIVAAMVLAFYLIPKLSAGLKHSAEDHE